MARALRAFIGMLLLISCTDGNPVSSGRYLPDVTRGNSSDGLLSPGGPAASATNDRLPLQRGSDQFIDREYVSGRTPRLEIEVVNDDDVEVTLVDASIRSAAEVILGDVLEQNFVVQDEVSGRITIQSTGPIPKSSLLDLFQAALSANGARLEREGDAIVVMAGGDSRRTFQTIGADGVPEGTIIVAPLQNISASQMVDLLAPLIDEGLSAVPDSERNLILLSGTSGQIEGAIDALNLFDVDVMRGKSIALVRLEAADPTDVVEELEAIFGSREGGSLNGVIEFHPNDRLNSVLVITSRSQYLDDAQRWIRELDRSAGQSRQYTRVYPIQNRQAAELAPVLDQVLGGLIQTGNDGEAGASSPSAAHQPRVAADPARNALIVRALQPEHVEVTRLLHDLDSRAAQVALEATIAEVTLNDDVSLGVRFFLDEQNSTTTFSDVASGAVTQNYPGFSSLFTFGDSSAVLNALSGVTDVKIISSPTLMVLDNEEAELQIGDQVPVATQTAVSTEDANAPVVTTIDYRDTGVILRVSPQIGAGNTLTLEISQEVSSVASTNTSGIDSPTIRQRQITTSVVLRDGATLALGGLVQESDNRSDTGVPGLRDVPFLGAAFRNRESTNARTELLILIRPRIIRDDHDADNFTSEWRGRLSDADQTLQYGLGDPTHSLEEILR